MQKKILIYSLIWFVISPVLAQPFSEDEKLLGEYYLTQKDMEKYNFRKVICIQRRIEIANNNKMEKLFDTIGYKEMVFNDDFKPIFFSEWNNSPQKFIYEYEYSLGEISKIIKKRLYPINLEWTQNYEPIIHLSSEWSLTDSITEHYCNDVKEKINWTMLSDNSKSDSIYYNFNISYNLQKMPIRVDILKLNSKTVELNTSLIVLKYDTQNRLISRYIRDIYPHKECLRIDYDINNKNDFSGAYEYTYKNKKDTLPYSASVKGECTKYTCYEKFALEVFLPYKYKPFSIFKNKKNNPYQKIKFKEGTSLPEVVTILNDGSIDIFTYQYV